MKTPRQTSRRQQTPRRKQTLRRKPTSRRRKQTSRRKQTPRRLRGGMNTPTKAVLVVGTVALATYAANKYYEPTEQQKTEEKFKKNEAKRQQCQAKVRTHLDSVHLDSVAELDHPKKVILVLDSKKNNDSRDVINQLEPNNTLKQIWDRRDFVKYEYDSTIYIDLLTGINSFDNLLKVASIIKAHGGLNLILLVFEDDFNPRNSFSFKLVQEVFALVPVVVVRTNAVLTNFGDVDHSDRTDFSKLQINFKAETRGRYKQNDLSTLLNVEELKDLVDQHGQEKTHLIENNIVDFATEYMNCT
jgi:hypothetical protein